MHTRGTDTAAAAVRHITCAIAVVCLTGCAVTALFKQDNEAGVTPVALHDNGSNGTRHADTSRSGQIVVARAGTVALPVAKKPTPKHAGQSLVSLDQFITVIVAGAMSLIVPAFVWLWRRIDESERSGV